MEELHYVIPFGIRKIRLCCNICRIWDIKSEIPVSDWASLYIRCVTLQKSPFSLTNKTGHRKGCTTISYYYNKKIIMTIIVIVLLSLLSIVAVQTTTEERL